MPYSVNLVKNSGSSTLANSAAATPVSNRPSSLSLTEMSILASLLNSSEIKFSVSRVFSPQSMVNESYLQHCQLMAARAQKTVNELKRCDVAGLQSLPNIEFYLEIAWRQLDQVESRLLDGESIPNEAKVFSVFEPRTRWIRKGKAGVLVELGVLECLIEEQHQFILHHKAPPQGEDEGVAVNNLERRNLDRVRSHGADGFEHLVALSILAANLHRLGWLLLRQERAPIRQR